MIYTINNKCSINDTINKMKENDTLILDPGIYREKVIIKASNIEIKGKDKENTIIINSDYYLKTMPDHAECNTFRTATFQVLGSNVKLSNFTIVNGAVPSKKYAQAVALYAAGTNFICDNMIIKSEQDTLFTGPLPDDLKERYVDFLDEDVRNSPKTKQKYINCTIEGDIDFIFGGAKALFKDCVIVCLNKRGYIAAPSHSKDDEFGYLFLKCNIIGNKEVDNNYYLARPWREYGKVAFINCNYDIYINDELFSKWNDTNRHEKCKFLIYDENYSGNLANFGKKLTKKEADVYVFDFLKDFGV